MYKNRFALSNDPGNTAPAEGVVSETNEEVVAAPHGEALAPEAEAE